MIETELSSNQEIVESALGATTLMLLRTSSQQSRDSRKAERGRRVSGNSLSGRQQSRDSRKAPEARDVLQHRDGAAIKR